MSMSMSMSSQDQTQQQHLQQSHRQQQANRGILPSETLNALDILVDRLNAATGRLPSADSTASSNDTPLPIRALLVGTNEGVGLSRSIGSAHTALQTAGDPTFSHSGAMSEEVLSAIETVWATLASAVPPHVMAANAAGTANSANDASGGNQWENEDKVEDAVPLHTQPPHPLLSPLLMGDHVQTVYACYENCALMHVHMAPLVVTFVTLPEANIGAIRSVALPLLRVLLEPVRRALVRSRGGSDVVDGEVGDGGGSLGGQRLVSCDLGQQGMSIEERAQHQEAQLQQEQVLQLQQQHVVDVAAQQQQNMKVQGTGMYPNQSAGAIIADPAALQQQLYQQQLYQQQLLMAQQQHQQQFRR